MPLASPSFSILRYIIGDTANLKCILNDMENPSVLPITTANVWVSIQKESTGLWLNFTSGVFDGQNYSSGDYIDSAISHLDGVYEYDFTPTATVPDGYIIVYTTDYGADEIHDTETVYFYYA